MLNAGGKTQMLEKKLTQLVAAKRRGRLNSRLDHGQNRVLNAVRCVQ